MYSTESYMLMYTQTTQAGIINVTISMNICMLILVDRAASLYTCCCVDTRLARSKL
jgi:hypothetical protein